MNSNQEWSYQLTAESRALHIIVGNHKPRGINPYNTDWFCNLTNGNLYFYEHGKWNLIQCSTRPVMVTRKAMIDRPIGPPRELAQKWVEGFEQDMNPSLLCRFRTWLRQLILKWVES